LCEKTGILHLFTEKCISVTRQSFRADQKYCNLAGLNWWKYSTYTSIWKIWNAI